MDDWAHFHGFDKNSQTLRVPKMWLWEFGVVREFPDFPVARADREFPIPKNFSLRGLRIPKVTDQNSQSHGMWLKNSQSRWSEFPKSEEVGPPLESLFDRSASWHYSANKRHWLTLWNLYWNCVFENRSRVCLLLWYKFPVISFFTQLHTFLCMSFIFDEPHRSP